MRILKKYLRNLNPRAFSHISHFLREIPENEVHICVNSEL